MCPAYNRKGFEVLTTQGQEKPDSQSVDINYEKVNDLKKKSLIKIICNLFIFLVGPLHLQKQRSNGKTRTTKLLVSQKNPMHGLQSEEQMRMSLR